MSDATKERPPKQVSTAALAGAGLGFVAAHALNVLDGALGNAVYEKWKEPKTTPNPHVATVFRVEISAPKRWDARATFRLLQLEIAEKLRERVVPFQLNVALAEPSPSHGKLLAFVFCICPRKEAAAMQIVVKRFLEDVTSLHLRLIDVREIPVAGKAL